MITGQRFIIILIAVFSFCSLTSAQGQLESYAFENLDSLQNLEKRIVVVFIHTSWCKYCKAMQNTTFKDGKIVALLTDKYYFIDLDAEQRSNITFAGQVFRYRPTGVDIGVHELAEQLGTIDNKVSYPSLCFLNADNEIILQYDQYMRAKDLKPILDRLLE